MRYLLILVMMWGTVYADPYIKKDEELYNRYVKEINHMSPIQIELLKKVYTRFNEHNLGVTGMAIVIHESKAGKYLFNPTTGDYGVCGINLKVYMRLKGIKQGYYKDIQMASILIKNENINIQASINNLLYWKKLHKNNWVKMLGSYNGGFTPNYKYSHIVYNIMLAVNTYIKNNKEFLK